MAPPLHCRRKRGRQPAQAAQRRTTDRPARLEPPDPPQISYAFRRQLGGMLDTRSARGRMLSPHRSARGVWALGEALGDAVVTRVPQAFDAQERADQRLA